MFYIQKVDQYFGSTVANSNLVYSKTSLGQKITSVSIGKTFAFLKWNQKWIHCFLNIYFICNIGLFAYSFFLWEKIEYITNKYVLQFKVILLEPLKIAVFYLKPLYFEG